MCLCHVDDSRQHAALAKMQEDSLTFTVGRPAIDAAA